MSGTYAPGNLDHFGKFEVTVGPYSASTVFCVTRTSANEGCLVTENDAEIGRLAMRAVTPRLSRTPARIRSPAPPLREQQDEVLPARGALEGHEGMP